MGIFDVDRRFPFIVDTGMVCKVHRTTLRWLDQIE